MSEGEVDYKKVAKAFQEVTGITPQPDGKTITDTDRLYWILMQGEQIAELDEEGKEIIESMSDFEKLLRFRKFIDEASLGSPYRKAPKHPDCERWGFSNKESAQ